MDPIQTMPEVDALVLKKYSVQDWLQYYKNIWTRNLAARCIDVETDKILKAEDPEQQVLSDQQMPIPVKERLELRKILVQDALDLIAGIDKLIELTPEEFVAQATSPEALAVAEDMKDQPKVGDACEVDGKAGTLQSDGQGGLVCQIPDEATPAPEAPVNQPVPGEDAN